MSMKTIASVIAYDLTAEFAGFKKVDKTAIEVRVNDVLAVDFQLEIGNAEETVEVSGATPPLETANVSLGQDPHEPSEF